MEPRELNPKQQTSEAVRAAESILVITGQNPTVDQVSSVVALGEILRKLGKKTHTLVSDNVPEGAKFIADGKVDRKLDGLRDFIMQLDLSRSEVDKLKYTIEGNKLNVHITPFRGGFAAQDVSFAYGDYQYDLIIVIGVATFNRVEKLYLQSRDLFKDVPVINIDFHRVNENYGAINLVDTNAASLSEMLVALAESLQTGIIDEPIATSLLTGIMAATDRFTANHTTPKALTVAAQMMALGANQQKVVKGLYSNQPKVESPKSKVEQRSTPEKPAPQTQQVPVNPQPHKQIIAGGVLQRAETPAQTAQAPEPSPQPAPVARVEGPASQVAETNSTDEIIDMLPPTHIELADQYPQANPEKVALTDEPEPLVNAAEEPTLQPSPTPTYQTPTTNPLEDNSDPKGRKAANPANNPVLISR